MPTRNALRTLAGPLCGGLLLLGAAGTAAQPAAPGGAAGIYTCTDARGRTLTSDRPIADCTDREQLQLNPSGTVRRVIEPTYSAREQAQREERQRQADLAAARQLEERRRERALLIRYPTPASHARARADALAQVDAVAQAAKKRLDELADDRKRIDEELEFYKNDVSKAPPSLRRQLADNQESVAIQNRFLREQDDEKKRINARFDDERQYLKPMWSAGGPLESP